MGEEKTIRSFVAVDTSPEVKAELSRLIVNIKGDTLLNAKWVKMEQMHFTLTFLGEVSPDFIEKTKAQLEPITRKFFPFTCIIEGIGAFPSPTRARVIWAGLKQGDKEIKQLQREVVKALIQVGYVPEKRPFTPHLTLARLREPRDVGFVNSITFKSSPFTVTRLILFRSVLKPEGAEYTIIKEFPFGGKTKTG